MRLARFKLRTIFFVVAMVAVLFGYVVNFGHKRASGLLAMSSGSPGGTAVVEAIEFGNSGKFVSDILLEPEVKTLSLFRTIKDPQGWLKRRLELKPIRPKSEILVVDLVRYQYLDPKQSMEDYSVIVEAAMRVLRQNAKPDVSISVLQMPTPPI